MKKLLYTTCILFLGIALGYYLAQVMSFDKPTYVELPNDFTSPELGTIKKGTKIKIDKTPSESFTRYVLYLNISDTEGLIGNKSSDYNLVIPYWIYSRKSN